MPTKNKAGYIEEMMRMAAAQPQGGMPPGPPPGMGMPPQGMPPEVGMPPQGMPPGPPPQGGIPPQGGGVQPGPMGPERMVPGALMIVELQGMFFLVPSIDEQGQQMDEAAAVQHLQQTGLFYAASPDPQALVDFAEQSIKGRQGGGRQAPPQGEPASGRTPPR